MNQNMNTNLEGESYLNMDQDVLLKGLNAGNFTPVGVSSRGMPIVEFHYDQIGTVVGQDGSILGTTNQATIHINTQGLIHIVPKQGIIIPLP